MIEQQLINSNYQDILDIRPDSDRFHNFVYNLREKYRDLQFNTGLRMGFEEAVRHSDSKPHKAIIRWLKRN